jgi:hypothetical protein
MTTNIVFGGEVVRLRLKCDGTGAETRFSLSAKRTSPFKSAGGVCLKMYDKYRPIFVRIFKQSVQYCIERPRMGSLLLTRYFSGDQIEKNSMGWGM